MCFICIRYAHLKTVSEVDSMTRCQEKMSKELVFLSIEMSSSELNVATMVLKKTFVDHIASFGKIKLILITLLSFIFLYLF